jgi:hypothetical protein
MKKGDVFPDSTECSCSGNCSCGGAKWYHLRCGRNI